jgi:hypothetical protein
VLTPQEQAARKCRYLDRVHVVFLLKSLDLMLAWWIGCEAVTPC